MLVVSEDKGMEVIKTDERVGKVFVVMAENVRKCMICERFFTRSESAEHAHSMCYPPVN